MNEPPAAAVHAVVLDCIDIARTARFWCALLGFGEPNTDPTGTFSWLGPLTENGPYLVLQRVPESRTGKNRMHVDMHAADREALLTRIVTLGGSKVRDHEWEGHRWTVMADPEGNEFCVMPEE
jgi:catechol 2,3-dioxygenase-like lactoylglutathione lyase family enzyme